MVLLLDDFHNIQTVRIPDNLKLSKATHMQRKGHFNVKVVSQKVTCKKFSPKVLKTTTSHFSPLAAQCQQLRAYDKKKQIKQFRCSMNNNILFISFLEPFILIIPVVSLKLRDISIIIIIINNNNNNNKTTTTTTKE